MYLLNSNIYKYDVYHGKEFFILINDYYSYKLEILKEFMYKCIYTKNKHIHHNSFENYFYNNVVKRLNII